MKNYYVTIWEKESRHPVTTDFYSFGQNAIDAFENACENGGVSMQPGIEHCVVVRSGYGLVIMFEAGMQ